MFICTGADYQYFRQLVNLIGSIHAIHFDDVDEIAVFDLGLKREQRSYLQNIRKVSVYDVELTHPKLLTIVESHPDGWGSETPGSRAWKPVILKQALDISPEILWLDAGHIIMRPLDNLFKHIRQHSYFLCGVWHSVVRMCSQRLIERFDLLSEERKWILSDKTRGLQSNIIGLTRDPYPYEKFVMPLYELSKDLELWMDDGTAPGYKVRSPVPGKGKFGNFRSQAIKSIVALLNGFTISKYPPHTELTVDGARIPFRVSEGATRLRTPLLYGLYARFPNSETLRRMVAAILGRRGRTLLDVVYHCRREGRAFQPASFIRKKS